MKKTKENTKDKYECMMHDNIRKTFIYYLLVHQDILYSEDMRYKSIFHDAVWDYVWQIDTVMSLEGYSSWYQVALNIKRLVVDCDFGGVYAGSGVVRRALRLFDRVCERLKLIAGQLEHFGDEKILKSLLTVSPNNSAVRLGDTVVWYDLGNNEDIVKMIVAGSAGAGEISCDAELVKESIGKEVGDVITVNKYKYEIKQIIRQN